MKYDLKKLRRREYYEKNRLLALTYSKATYNKNKKSILAANKIRYEANKEKYKEYQRKLSLKKLYFPELSLEEAQKAYDSFLLKQNNLCAICNKAETRTSPSTGKIQKLSVDHCHISGKVRGLLCFRCNTSLGFYEKYKNKLSEYLLED